MSQWLFFMAGWCAKATLLVAAAWLLSLLARRHPSLRRASMGDHVHRYRGHSFAHHFGAVSDRGGHGHVRAGEWGG
jgi:hypothetical protein